MRDLEPKVEMMRRLDEGWSDIVALVDSLPEEELEQPGVTGEWSVKDLMGHMAFWSEKSAGDLRLLREGRSEAIQAFTTDQEADELNDREYRLRKDRPVAEVRAEWSRSFEDARRALDETPEDLLWQEVKGWPQAVRFGEDTYNHYREHAGQIREWIRRTETSEE